MRFFISLVMGTLLVSSAAAASDHPHNGNSKTYKAPPTHSHDNSRSADSEFTLPSQGDIEEIIAQMPDFNGMMNDMVNYAKDEERQKQWGRSANILTQRIEESGVLEPNENGLPDINGLMAIMLRAVADKEVMAPVIDTAEDMEQFAEKYMDKDDDNRGRRR